MLASPQKSQQGTAKAARRRRLHSVLCLPPPAVWATPAKTIRDDDSSDISSSSENDDSTAVPSKRLQEAVNKEGVAVSVKISNERNQSHSPPRPIMLQATSCMHRYPVAPRSQAHHAFTERGSSAPLCPHCAIAMPSSSSAAAMLDAGGREQQQDGTHGDEGQKETSDNAPATPPKGAITITTTRCGHALTVRRSTAAIVAANPLTFSCPPPIGSASPCPDNPPSRTPPHPPPRPPTPLTPPPSDRTTNKKKTSAKKKKKNKNPDQPQPPDHHHHPTEEPRPNGGPEPELDLDLEPWPGFTRAASPAALAVPPRRRKRVRANLNVERCVACVRRELSRSQREVVRSRKELRAVEADAEALMTTTARAVAAAAVVDPDPEWEELAAARLSVWRRRWVGLRCGLEVLVGEGERAAREERERGREASGEDGEEWEEEGGEEEGDRGRARSRKLRRAGSIGSLRGLARSVGWPRKDRGERRGSSASVRSGAALKSSLRMSSMTDAVEEEGKDDDEEKMSKEEGDETKKKRKRRPAVHFDPKTTNFDGRSRSLSRFERKNMYYRPGKWARDGMLLDTSGFNLKTEKEVMAWHFPPSNHAVMSDRGVLATKRDEGGERTRDAVKRIISKTWWL